jgi:serine phosphatase RsbU (regulator of sigma subunit)
MKTRFLLLFIAFKLFSFTPILSQEIGKPFIQNYLPNEYKGEAQVWASTRDNNGILYIANNENVYQYNGKKWQTILIKKNEAVRSLDVSKQGTVYVGAFGDFGYLKPDSIGRMQYVSLINFLDSTDKDFSDVWNTYTTDDAVFFSSNKALFRFELTDNNITGKYKVWKAGSDGLFVLAFRVNDEIYTSKRGKGILKIEGDSLLPAKGNEQLNKHFIWNMLAYKKDKILIAAADGLYTYTPKAEDTENIIKQSGFNETDIKQTNEFIKQNQLYNATQLNDSTYAFATILNGIIIVNDKGKIIRHINKEDGLPSNTVHHLYLDKGGILWASTAFGISKIEISTPISYWDEKNGLKGVVYNVIRHKNKIYGSTNIGTFYLNNNKFKPIKGLTGRNALQCFDLQNIKPKHIPNEQKLIVCANGTFFQIKENKATSIFHRSAFGFLPSGKDSSKLYFFENNLLFDIHMDKDKFTISDTIYNSENYPTALAETSGNNLWIIENEKPVLISPGIRKNASYKARFFTEEPSIKGLSFADALQIDNKNYFTVGNSIYRFNKEKSLFEKDSLLFNGLLNNIQGDIKQLEQINKDLSFICTEVNGKNKIMAIRKADGHFVLDSAIFKRLPEFDYFRKDDSRHLWVISPNQLYLIDLDKTFKQKNNKKTIIYSVKLPSDSLIYAGGSENNETVNLSFTNNNLAFEYATPYLIKENATEYSYRLEGDNKLDEWSDWSKEGKKEFTNLYEGDYVFWVKSRNVFGEETEASSYHFTILAPWYRSIFAYLAYLVLAALFIWLIIKLNMRRLIKEKEQLEEIVKERTAEISQQNEEIRTQAENLKEINNHLVESNEEVNQQKEEIQTILDNLQEAYDSITYMNTELAKANNEITSKNEKITDSIRYAKRIQFAVLPPESFLEKHFAEHFVLFKPKDIVSGDFYWFRKIENYVLFAVADGTGHGVPGAFISMMGTTYLNEITNRTDLNHANEVLNILRDEVKKSLKTDDETKTRDGMDIAFGVLNKETNELQFAGAHHPLYLFRNGNFTIIEGDKMPIGVNRKEDSFTNHKIQLEKGDTLYMFSDGYADQFGGTMGRKFLIKRFKQLLQTIHTEPIAKQKEILEKEFNNWKGDDYEQVDDILILGLRI